MKDQPDLNNELTPKQEREARESYAAKHGSEAFTPSAEPPRPIVRHPEIVKSFAPHQPEIEPEAERTLTPEEHRKVQEEYRRQQGQ